MACNHQGPPKGSLTRREALRSFANGFGMLGLAGLLAQEQRAYALDAALAGPLAVRPAQFTPRAKNLIFLFMSGGPSHVDTFDPKPRLTAENGKPFGMKMEPTQFNNNGSTLGSPWEFQAHGRSGLPVSFTGGFHPLPRLQFALSLPLGVEGLGEWFDLEFTESAERLDGEATRRRLQQELPAEFQLLSVEPVPVFGPSLSQEVVASHWRFVLRPLAAPEDGRQGVGSGPGGPEPADWDRAIGELLEAEALPWNDQDKKGRPRQRDCRSALLALRRLAPPEPDGRVSLELKAAIDPQGRGLRPEQIQFWLAQRLGFSLELEAVQRQALQLRAC